MNTLIQRALLPAALAAALLAPAPRLTAATTVILDSIADAALFEYQPDNNQGGMLDLPSGALGITANGTRARALYKFDIAGQLPGDAFIESVTLTLHANIQPPSPVHSTFGLHRVLKDWGEGTGTGNQGSPAKEGEVTWHSRFHDIAAWTSPGAEAGTDFVAASSADTFVNGLGAFQWSSSGLAADVQYWLANPSENFGWMLISDNEVSLFTAKRFGAREIGDPALRPSLAVQYTIIPEPGTAALGALALAGLGGLGWRRRRA